MRLIKEVLIVFLLFIATAIAAEDVSIGSADEISANCGDLDCFKVNFEDCQPSILTLKFGTDKAYEYEIKKDSTSGCEVASKFSKHPDRAWYNKKMSCVYDNSIDFEEAVNDRSKCSGELYELFIAPEESEEEESTEETTGEEEESTEEEKEEPKKVIAKKSAPKKTVSLCGGCMIGNSCVNEGAQKSRELGGAIYYCSSDLTVEPAGDISESCTADYECESYFCDGGLCNAVMDSSNSPAILAGVLIFVIIILIIGAYFLVKMGIVFKKLGKEEDKMDKGQQPKKPLFSFGKSNPSAQKPLSTQQKPYKYRPEFDQLEKKMNAKFKGGLFGKK